MKNLKKIMFGIGAAVVCTCAVTIEQHAVGSDTDNEILAKNIEALTGDEITKPWVYPEGVESGRFECGGKYPDGKKCTFKVVTCAGGGKGCNPRPCNIHG